MLKIVPVHSKKLLNRFIDFPHQLYRGDNNYVPQLNMMQKQLLKREKNPFFHNAEAAYFLAVEGGKVVGRIAAINNKAHTDIYHDGTGFFGFFDCVENFDVANALLNTASLWLKAKGIQCMIGPENLTTNDSVGILTNGFESPPVFQMPYNFSYYASLLEDNGCKPTVTLYSYLLNDYSLLDELKAQSVLLEKRLHESGVQIRCVNLKKYEEDVEGLRNVYNAANEGSWGFLPLNRESFFHMARDLKQIVKPEHILIAEKDAKIIGYAVSVPDLNQIFKKISRGKLFPFGWYNLLTQVKKINGFRIMILGVLPYYRRLGIDWCLYAKVAENAINMGMKWGEACYVMEQNIPMNRMLQRMHATIVKEYKIFRKEI